MGNGFLIERKAKKGKTMQERYQKLLAAYLLKEKQSGCNTKGLLGLKNRVPKLFEYLEETGTPLEEVGVKEAQAYQGWLLTRRKQDGGKYARGSVLAYLEVAAAFFEYLKTKSIILSNPFKEIRKLKSHKKLPRKLLKEKELNLLLEELARFDQASGLKNQISLYRTHVAGELMYATGLRISEVAQLSVEDIQLERGMVKVREGKGGLKRNAYLNEYAKEVLKLYLQQTRELTFNAWNHRNKELLFGTGWQSFEKVMNRNLKEVAARLGHKRFTSHQFRHALGYHLLRAGCNIRHIQAILGHRRLRNTEIYTQVDKESLKEVIEKYHPRHWRRR